ncbi:transcription factor subunit Med10 of mediator complex-domain-containing protein [Jimgerdemannia flammicorona]|uniref:Mediator of RNA polymerase II transcription subunit 10 n=1 Tax=Jimgerdemannia flammicorona TaxID=994334 RepID=A0A433B9P7_9FUNG|nr:transcription factor subunit Med10 of mediator complex-domain-containing protein [Jimgerdemannia flammicorona]
MQPRNSYALTSLFSLPSRILLLASSNQVVTHFADLDKLKEGISSLYVPEEVVKYVEEARNPDIFTQGFVERAAAENQFTNGKIRAIESFRSILVTELTTSFPDLAPALSPASANPSLNGIATTANPPPPLHANGASSSASPASSMSTTASPAGGINGRH